MKLRRWEVVETLPNGDEHHQRCWTKRGAFHYAHWQSKTAAGTHAWMTPVPIEAPMWDIHVRRR